jgi:5'-phosphate synthase pdxT subunit
LLGCDAIVLPGGESTAIGLIGTSSGMDHTGKNLWESLQEFSQKKPTWGTCAGMILLAEKCIGTSAVITDGQSLIGGVDITVCRNYFGSQVSSFEMATPPPPGLAATNSFPGIFIRAPAILSCGPDVEVLGKVVATPCRQAAVTLNELEKKIAAGENVVKMGVVDALDRASGLNYIVVVKPAEDSPEEKKDVTAEEQSMTISLPGASDGTNAREVICAARKGNLLCTAFHPELTDDYRWHEYFVKMVKEAKSA